MRQYILDQKKTKNPKKPTKHHPQQNKQKNQHTTTTKTHTPHTTLLKPTFLPCHFQSGPGKAMGKSQKLRKRWLLSIQLIDDAGQDCISPNPMYPTLQPLPPLCLQRALWDNTIPCRQNAGQRDIVSRLAALLLLGDWPLSFKGPFLFREKQ